METISKDLISLLQYLLPGFISAWVFYAFTSFPKPSQFERVVQALIFTTFIQAMILPVKAFLLFIGHFFILTDWNAESRLICSIVCAILLGFVFSYFSNNDKFHSFLRKIKLTKETSFASEWFGVFSNKKYITYVILHLKDERRLYGWPMEWPSEPNNGQFLITDASWVHEEGKNQPTEVDILMDVKYVKWVEFVDKTTWEK